MKRILFPNAPSKQSGFSEYYQTVVCSAFKAVRLYSIPAHAEMKISHGGG